MRRFVFRGAVCDKSWRSGRGSSGEIEIHEIRDPWLELVVVLLGERFVAPSVVERRSLVDRDRAKPRKACERSPARSPLAAGFPATRPAVARLCRLRRPPEPERPAKPSVCACRHTRGRCQFNLLRALGVAQTGAGWFDGSLAHPVRSGRDSLRCICHCPAAGDERDGAAAPALAASAAGHSARLRAANRRESHGRKPAHHVSPLATFSQHHAKLLRTHSTKERPVPIPFAKTTAGSIYAISASSQHSLQK